MNGIPVLPDRMVRGSALVLAISLAIGTLGCASGPAQAIDSGLPYGVQILSLAVSPDYEKDQTLLIGTRSGIYRSEDGASTWTESGKGLERPGLSVPVIEIAFSPDFGKDREVYAATRLGLMKSTDAGRSWRSVDPAGVRISRSDTPITDMPVEVAVSPRYAEDGRVLAVYRMEISFSYQAPPERRVLFESTDRGATWDRIGDDSDGVPTYDIQVRSDAAIVGSAGNRVLIRRTGSGDWETIAEFGPAYRVALPPDYQDGQPVVLGNGLGETVHFRRGDEPVSTGFRLGRRTRGCLSVERPGGYGSGPDCLTSFTVAVQDGHGASVFAVPDEDGSDRGVGIMRSDDGGVTWVRLGLPTFERVVAVAVSPGYPGDRTVFAAARSQVFRSTDAGGSWQATKPRCEWDPHFPSSIDWAPFRSLDQLVGEPLVKGRPVVKVKAIDYERVDRDGARVVNTVEVVRVFAGDISPGRAAIRDGFLGQGRCLLAGEEYYLIVNAGGHDEAGVPVYDLMDHPLMQLAVRDGRMVAAPFWDESLLGRDLNGMPEAEFVKELERSLASN